MTEKKQKPDEEAPRARTMADIARIAGVAESTVSRALADHSRVSSKTKAKINEIVKESGYKINTRARSLRTQKSHTIAVVIAITEKNRQHFSDPFFTQIIASIGDTLAAHNYDMLLSNAQPWKHNNDPDVLASNRVDGAIIIGQGDDPEALADYATSHPNMIVWGADISSRPYPVIGSDNLLGGRLVGQHFLESNRKRVVFLGDIRHTEIGLRHRGCMEALTAAGASPEQTLTLSMPFDSQSAYNATQELFQSNRWHDAIFAATDVLAMAAMSALADLGLKVPDDVAVVGYDDIAFAAYTSPPLTSVRQDTDAAGKALVENLLLLLEGGAPRDIILPTELIVRRSCGVK